MVTVPVPPLRYETRQWVAADDGLSSRAARRAGTGPYESALVPAVVDLDLRLPPAVAADLEDATTALTRFDAHAGARLGLDSPSLGPMSAILLRTESTSSSQIENLTVSARQLALAELDEARASNARVVLANVRAMEAALALADRIDAPALLTMQAELLRAQRGGARHAGVFRDEPVWIGTSRVGPAGADFVPPRADLVPDAVADLVDFVAREDLPVLAHAAVAHAQFETIHPFTDGNGRTGRALVQAMLRAKGVVTSTTAPVSAGLLRDTAGYVAALTAYRAGEAGPLLACFADAARFAARSGTLLVDELDGHLADARAALAAAGLRRHAGAWALLPQLVAHPVVNSALLTRGGMSNQAAQRALAQLTDAGVLVERSGARRNRIWQHAGILATLDAYAAGLRRD